MTGIKPYAKAWLAALGVALTVASQVLAPNSTAGICVTLLVAMGTVFGVYRVPNTPAVPDAVAAIKALDAERAAMRAGKTVKP